MGKKKETPAAAPAEKVNKTKWMKEAILAYPEKGNTEIAKLLDEKATSQGLAITFTPGAVAVTRGKMKAGGTTTSSKKTSTTTSVPKFSFSEVTMKVQEFSSKFGADELLELATSLPALVQQVGGADEFRKMVELLGKK